VNRKQKISDETVARLLSGRNAPSVLEKERLFEHVFQQVALETKPTRARWQPLAFAFASALCLVAVLLLRPHAPEFAARGGLGLSEPTFRPLCNSGADALCKQGQALGFEVMASAEPQYFAAFAQRPDGAIVWYLPEASGKSLQLSREPGSPVLDRGVQIGTEQPPGHYEVFGVFSSRPLTRAEIKSAVGDDLRGSRDVRVVRRSIEVGQ